MTNADEMLFYAKTAEDVRATLAAGANPRNAANEIV